MSARLGMISQWYDPERGSASTPGSIARSLVRHGHTVDVVTGFPNYPTGNLYPGYAMRPYRREVLAGVTVHRAPLYPSHDSHPVRRATNYLTFAASAAVTASAKLGDVDAVLVHSTPATAAIPAMAVKALRRTPFVVHIQDLWPQTVLSSGFLDGGSAGRVERVLQKFCDTVYRHAYAIAVTSPGMAEIVARRGVPDEKITFVPNWADESVFRPVARDAALAHALGIVRPFSVMYAGNFGEFQALEVTLEAAKLLRDVREIGFVLVGGGVQEGRLRAIVRERGLDNVTFVEPQPFAKMADILALGEVQLMSLQDHPLFRTTMPSKLQATLAAGRPIVAAVSGDAASAVQDSGAGPVVAPGSAQAMAEAVLALYRGGHDNLAELGARGRQFYSAHYSETVAVGALSELLEAAAGAKGQVI